MTTPLERRLAAIEERLEEIDRTLADPAVAADPGRLRPLAEERASIAPTVEAIRRRRSVAREIDEARSLAGGPDPDLAAMAREEVTRLEAEAAALDAALRRALLPRDPRDSKGVILEIRAGTGGEEAALFAGELLRMYQRYADRRGWRFEILSANETGLGGYKEVIVAVTGDGAYSRLKHEAGTHRVQRVPVTESAGRIHTSAATVAVLSEADEVETEIDPKDLRIDVFRSGGHGGQGVNTTDSAVRLTHIPTGIVVTCQDERSQIQNKAKAMRVLRARLHALAEEEARSARAEARRSMVGTGDRSGRIRTYNFPQNRVTDHRVDVTLYRLPSVLEGEIDEIVDALLAAEEAEALARLA